MVNEKIRVVCPHCNSTNNVPGQRIEHNPLCGKCRQKLFIASPLELTGLSFEKHISNSNIPVLVDFWASWCGPCKMMAPVIGQAASRLEPYVRVAKLNTESEQSIAARYNIRSIPTLVLFKQGYEIAREAGAVDLDRLLDWVRSRI